MSWQTRKQAQGAARREQQLLEDIAQRGSDLGMEPDRVSDALRAAQEEIRQRGMGHEQIMGNLPDDPTECCFECSDGAMNSDSDEY